MHLPAALFFLLSLAANRIEDVSAILVTVPTADCGLNPVDIHFLLDASGSIKAENFTVMLNFVKAFIDDFDVGPTKAQFGVTTFATTPANQFWLKDYQTKATLLSAVGRIPYSQGSTQTDQALDFVRLNAFTAGNGDRPGAMNVLIVITDGESQDTALTKAAAARVHQSGIIVLGVGVGSGTNVQEVLYISSDSSRYFHVDNFEALFYIKEKLQKKSCEVCPFWTGSDAVFLDGKCIKYFSKELTYEEAKAACEAEDKGITLVEVKTANVRAHTQDKAQTEGKRIWLGATDADTEGTFKWVRGDVTNIDPTWWGANQPDDSYGNEDCLIMRQDRMLNDYGCNYKLPYFCESIEVRMP